MIGEVGHFALIWVAISSTLFSAQYAWQKWSLQHLSLSLKPISRLNGVLASLSLICLAVLFLSDQFQFNYVAAHSNVALNDFFKIAAVWGGHEGSMLFWVFTLAIWTLCISFVRRAEQQYLQDVLLVMQLFVAAFAWFTLLASNPFEYADVLLKQGRDLNPMLQDVGLIFHPPLLYLGYIGFSTTLAFALAALMQPTYQDDWVKLSSPWAISAWAFLTIGILVGSWWAYNELGWGGWWFWDPVENASLLPWLTGTALLHAMLASKHHQQMKVWTLTLALITFSLSILGTFIVRSGVLTSVHAFAVDPGKGVALLAIMGVTLLASFSLLLLRSDSISSVRIQALFSRSYLALVSIGLLIVATFTVFLGTFYPMVYELAGLGSISVGAPYFNTLIMPLSLIALAAMGCVPLLKWNKGSAYKPKATALLFLASLMVGGAVYFVQVSYFSFLTAIVWGLAVWVVVTHLLLTIQSKHLSFMVFAHIGIAISTVGAVMNSEQSFEMSHKLAPGVSVSFMDWQVDYRQTHWYIGSNFTAELGEIHFVSDQHQFVLKPERRHYPVRVMNMSEPAIKPFWHGDYYVTLGSKVDAESYAVKIQYKAYIGWIWGGVIFAILGSLIPLFSAIPQFRRVPHGVVHKA